MLTVEEISKIYKQQKTEIKKRLKEFKNLYKTKNAEKLFAELCFCLLTPQSKAKICWNAVMRLKQNGLLFEGSQEQIQDCLTGVRFNRKKSKYIIGARKPFPQLRQTLTNYEPETEFVPHFQKNVGNHGIRKWLVRNICGLGHKEASHFLRNIGLGDNLAILDRHILKNLKEIGCIKNIPSHLTSRNYIEIENKMKKFSKKVGIPVSHLDLLFWSKETGEIFK